ncbi:hypothetical protein ACFW04_011252 [Cataglyphis niger]
MRLTLNYINRWKQSGFISPVTYKFLYVGDGTLPRAYELPKIHKQNCRFKIVVSYLNSSLYKLLIYLHKIMFKIFPTAHSHILNSFQLVNRLADISINDNFILISLDVVFLFTNIPIELSIASIYGTPMGSPLFPIIENIVLQNLEKKALDTLTFIPPFYVRYVDDAALAVLSSLHECTLNIFNYFHPRIVFLLSHSRFHQKNLIFITNILLDNNYLLNFIPSYFSLDKLHQFIKVQKGCLPKLSTIETYYRNVFYKINYNDCNASYVDQTNRKLDTKIKEHRNHIRRNTSSHSVITDHRLSYYHEFRWNEVEVLDEELNFNKRLISEMLYIKRQRSNLNLQTDTKCLHETYVTAIIEHLIVLLNLVKKKLFAIVVLSFNNNILLGPHFVSSINCHIVLSETKASSLILSSSNHLVQ